MAQTPKRVLIVDDSGFARDIIAGMLSKIGYNTFLATNMEGALRDQELVSFDLVITDIQMPGIGGIEGISRLRETWPESKIIAMSGAWSGDELEKVLETAKRSGADH